MAVKQWKNTTHLIIDEISMIDGHYFTMLDQVGDSINYEEWKGNKSSIRLVVVFVDVTILSGEFN